MKLCSKHMCVISSKMGTIILFLEPKTTLLPSSQRTIAIFTYCKYTECLCCDNIVIAIFNVVLVKWFYWWPIHHHHNNQIKQIVSLILLRESSFSRFGFNRTDNNNNNDTTSQPPQQANRFDNKHQFPHIVIVRSSIGIYSFVFPYLMQ